ncbi:MAG: ParB/RepB/Spo0J family partition protein [Alphaproteobacteria bacterium]|nr:ParB/RepB/Spo0J family partition protein [Alphaproteobacteria bacterium]
MTPVKKTSFSGLGRGLSALLGEVESEVIAASTNPNLQPQQQGHASGAPAEARAPRTLPIALLRPNPFQPREHFEPEALEELANSIRDKGIIQPIIVRPVPGQPDEYQIVAGERRWRAAQKARLHEVPVVIRAFTDAEALEVALIENIQRADLNPIEEARGYRQLIEKFDYTQEALGSVIGRSRSHIANTIRLLQLPQTVQDYIYSGKLSAGHARTLVGQSDPESMACELIEGRLNVREAEEKSRKAKGKKKRPHGKDADTRALEQSLAGQLGLNVNIAHKGDKGGELKIAYKTLEQLDDICRKLGAGT